MGLLQLILRNTWNIPWEQLALFLVATRLLWQGRKTEQKIWVFLSLRSRFHHCRTQHPYRYCKVTYSLGGGQKEYFAREDEKFRIETHSKIWEFLIREHTWLTWSLSIGSSIYDAIYKSLSLVRNWNLGVWMTEYENLIPEFVRQKFVWIHPLYGSEKTVSASTAPRLYGSGQDEACPQGISTRHCESLLPHFRLILEQIRQVLL